MSNFVEMLRLCRRVEKSDPLVGVLILKILKVLFVLKVLTVLIGR